MITWKDWPYSEERGCHVAPCDHFDCEKTIAVYHVLDTGANWCEKHLPDVDRNRTWILNGKEQSLVEHSPTGWAMAGRG